MKTVSKHYFVAAVRYVFRLFLRRRGMWLFNNPPSKILQDKYHFQPQPFWLEHLQKSLCDSTAAGPDHSSPLMAW